jgi:hypothetical protein
MPNPIPSAQLIPPSRELRLRLAVALREVDLLRRMIRLADFAAQFELPNCACDLTRREGTRCRT